MVRGNIVCEFCSKRFACFTKREECLEWCIEEISKFDDETIDKIHMLKQTGVLYCQLKN